MSDGKMFTAGNVFVFADPYLKLMDGESGVCVGYMPKKETENLIDIIGGKARAYPEWVSSWFDEKKKRHFISLSWNDPVLREKFVACFNGLPETERGGIIRDAECEALDADVAEDLNEKARKEEEARSAERRAWFAEKGNAEAAGRVSVLKGTCVVDEKTGRKKIEPGEGQFIDGIIRFMGEADKPVDVAYLGNDEDGKFWIAYSFRLETLRREFERRVEKSRKKPDGILFVRGGALYEELVMRVAKRNMEKDAEEEAVAETVGTSAVVVSEVSEGGSEE